MVDHPPDPYRVLGLPADASAADVGRAYRHAARRTHPDARPGDPDAAARFHAVADAYDLLSDPDRRAAYDRSQRQFPPPVPFAPAAASPAPPAPFAPAPPASLWAGPVYVDPPASGDTLADVLGRWLDEWRWPR